MIAFILGSAFETASRYMLLLLILIYLKIREILNPYILKKVMANDTISTFTIMLTLILVMLLRDFESTLIVL